MTTIHLENTQWMSVVPVQTTRWSQTTRLDHKHCPGAGRPLSSYQATFLLVVIKVQWSSLLGQHRPNFGVDLRHSTGSSCVYAQHTRLAQCECLTTVYKLVSKFIQRHGRKESEALRWVARQWRSWTEKGVTLNVDGMLIELHKNGH